MLTQRNICSWRVKYNRFALRASHAELKGRAIVDTGAAEGLDVGHYHLTLIDILQVDAENRFHDVARLNIHFRIERTHRTQTTPLCQRLHASEVLERIPPKAVRPGEVNGTIDRRHVHQDI